MRLHLGCGRKLWDGWENIDAPGSGAPVECDIRKLPYDSDTADEIAAIHVVEHLYLSDVIDTLSEWRRVLKPGGRLTVELPCRDNVFAMIRAGETAPNLTLWPIFGDPSTIKSEHDLHKWLWSKNEMACALLEAGFHNIRSEGPRFHVPDRDMRFVAVK